MSVPEISVSDGETPGKGEDASRAFLSPDQPAAARKYAPVFELRCTIYVPGRLIYRIKALTL